MHSVKLDKNQLLEILNQNKQTHVAEYNESVEDYLAAVIKVTSHNHKVAKEKKLENQTKFKTLPPPPKSHEVEYNRVIRMLELSVDNEIELDATQFSQYVQDDWSWKQGFAATSSFYKTLT